MEANGAIEIIYPNNNNNNNNNKFLIKDKRRNIRDERESVEERGVLIFFSFSASFSDLRKSDSRFLSE